MQVVVVSFGFQWWYRNAADKGAERFGPYPTSRRAKEAAEANGHTVVNIKT
jgi:hypothetical protein